VRSGRGRGSIGHVHEAGFYASDLEFLQLIVPFVTEGLAAGEPVVIGFDDRKSRLVRAALAQPEAVDFSTDGHLYATPAMAIEAYRQLFERSAGAEQIRIAGDVPHEGNGGRFAGWDRYESAVNTVWQKYPVYSRCLYDTTTAAAEVVDVVERTHRQLITADGQAAPSWRYQDGAEFEPLPARADPLEGSCAQVTLVDAPIARVVREVGAQAQTVLEPITLSDLLFALSEAVSNAEEYGCPPTTIRVWTDSDHVVVHVHDMGFGPDDPLTGLVPTPDNAYGPGLGLWLSHQLEDIDIALVRDRGFTVRLRAEA
jgi:anti-sigma regulatory factor (Ser/Thr protein kinase)